ncbi:general secretion pathway protein GspC [Burkholderia sp. WAC0059]|uniref:general secretion pathway protein GspC n=1 Tax=Burkholderia sp. WAC0059 TaxID=2066022 RepID=UPI002155C5D2|nr:general secretion pathway protein GspC [Burkholderia sp. WAC0059]
MASALLLAGSLIWSVQQLRQPLPVPPAAPAPVATLDAKSGQTLFGAQPDGGKHDAIQLLGILSFDARHAAAVISTGGDAARVVGLQAKITDATTLTDVRPHSIVVEHNGVQREIPLTAPQNPLAFVR